MEYFLMHRDEVVTLCNITDEGQMISWSEHFRNRELAPLEHRASSDYLRRWWKNRQIPIHQGRLEKMLTERGLTDPGDFLIKNLGLSLTDHYWMKPVDSALRWADVNLFDNDFRENILRSIESGWSRNPRRFTPNSFEGTEAKLLKLVTDKRRIDLNRALSGADSGIISKGL